MNLRRTSCIYPLRKSWRYCWDNTKRNIRKNLWISEWISDEIPEISTRRNHEILFGGMPEEISEDISSGTSNEIRDGENAWKGSRLRSWSNIFIDYWRTSEGICKIPLKKKIWENPNGSFWWNLWMIF